MDPVHVGGDTSIYRGHVGWSTGHHTPWNDTNLYRFFTNFLSEWAARVTLENKTNASISYSNKSLTSSSNLQKSQILIKKKMYNHLVIRNKYILIYLRNRQTPLCQRYHYRLECRTIQVGFQQRVGKWVLSSIQRCPG